MDRSDQRQSIRIHRPTRFVVGAWSSLLICAGCQDRQLPKLPPIHAARGEVIASTDLQLEGGTVEFTPLENQSEYIAHGVIDEEMKFALRTSHRGGMARGLVEGPYAAAIYFPLSSPRTGERIDIVGSFVVEPRDDNFFTVELPGKLP